MDQQIFDVETWRQVIVNSLTELLGTVAAFLPSLVGTLVLLAFGWLVSRLVEFASARALSRVGLDRVAERVRISATLERAGLVSPLSTIVGRLLFWVLMLTFVLSAVETLGLDAVTHTIDRLITFLPNVIASGLILVLGLLLARFVGNVASSGAAAAGMPEARRLGAVAGGATTLVAGVLAIEQLGIETAFLVSALTALLVAFGATIGVTFALGARPIVTHILAGHYLRQSVPPESSVEVEGRRGIVERVGSVDTLLRNAEHAWSIPNARLLEQIIQR
jgi:hypothetical protein